MTQEKLPHGRSFVYSLRIFDAFFLLIQAASPKKYERMLLQMQAFDEHPLIFHGSESLHYFFKASSAAWLAASNPL